MTGSSTAAYNSRANKLCLSIAPGADIHHELKGCWVIDRRGIIGLLVVQPIHLPFATERLRLCLDHLQKQSVES